MCIRDRIDVLNRFHVRVPKGVPLIGGMDFGFDLSHVSAPQLPMLAKGGYVGPNQPPLVMIGDNRHEGEIVAPESKLRPVSYTHLAVYKRQTQSNHNVDTAGEELGM